MRGALLIAVLASFGARAAPVHYAVAIGNNSPPAQQTGTLPELRYADDDAVRWDAFFSRFTDRRWLLAVLDAQTRLRHPEAAEAARPPTLRALRSVVAELKRRMADDVARGDEPVLYLTYSGHGAQGTDGAVFLTFADGELTRQVLHDEVLAAVPATFIHLIIDACHAEAVVGSRGLFSSERDAKTAPLAPAELEAVVQHGSLKGLPHVGALLAATADQESHEWALIESGVFTHEVLSGLSGAADVNSDGAIEYSELQAFVASANRDIKDPRALPRVVSLPPPANPRAPLVTLSRLQGVAFLEDDLSSLGHFHVELDDGARYLDAHLSSEGMSRIALPADRRAYLVTANREAELNARAAETVRLQGLKFQPKGSQSRGAIDTTFRVALFQSPFGPTYYRGFADSAGATPVPFVSASARLGASATRRTLAFVSVGAAGASLLTAGVLGLFALQAQRDYDATMLQRAADEARDRFRRTGTTAVVMTGAAVAFGIAAWLLWPPGSGQPAIAVSAWDSGAGFALSGRF